MTDRQLLWLLWPCCSSSATSEVETLATCFVYKKLCTTCATHARTRVHPCVAGLLLGTSFKSMLGLHIGQLLPPLKDHTPAELYNDAPGGMAAGEDKAEEAPAKRSNLKQTRQQRG